MGDGPRRGLAACSVMQAHCGETLPGLSFAEQRIASLGLAAYVSGGDSVIEGESLADIIDQLAGPGAVLVSELLNVKACWISHAKWVQPSCMVSRFIHRR